MRVKDRFDAIRRVYQSERKLSIGSDWVNDSFRTSGDRASEKVSFTVVLLRKKRHFCA
jgi:hypothetical protein